MIEQTTNLEKLAEYPFLKEAKEYAARLNLTLAAIERHPVYSAAIEQGRQRAVDGINGRITNKIDDQLSQELSILSYAIARILVQQTKNKFLINKYANAEADLAYNFLLNEDKQTIEAIAQDLDFKPKDGKLSFTDYLKLSAGLSKNDPRWKLVNKPVEKGFVEITEIEKLPLLREAIKNRVTEPINTSNIPENLKQLSKHVASLYERKPSDIKITDLKIEALPPCIKSMISGIEAGITSHNERFILATFLFGAGLDLDGVVKVFSRYPNFNEEKTRYQLQFLAGEKSATKYSCPSCPKIKTYGLCKKDCNTKHPLNYYQKNAGQNRK
jgi:DNA primase large subunit